MWIAENGMRERKCLQDHDSMQASALLRHAMLVRPTEGLEDCSGPACSLATEPQRVWNSEMTRVTGIRPTSYTLGNQTRAPPAPYRSHPYYPQHTGPSIAYHKLHPDASCTSDTTTAAQRPASPQAGPSTFHVAHSTPYA
jgi:hypothetical protein